MKKILVTLAVLGTALWSCNRSDIEGVDNPEREIGSNYLTVSIVSTMESGTRADDGDGEYEYGDPDENEVKNVRFYFFDANGVAQAVKRNSDNTGWDTYYDITSESEELTTSVGTNDNVEKIINAILVLESPKGDQVPASLVAIVNYNKKVFGDKDLNAGTITDLLANIGKYTESNDNEGYSYESDGFFMSSTVYRPATGSTVVEHKLKPEDFKRNPDDAKLNPVEIYVERAVAKVSLHTNIDKAIEATGDEAENALDGKFFPVYETVTGQDPVHLVINGTEIYTEFLGWNVTQTADISYAVKNLDPSWTIEESRTDDNPFAFWSSIDYHRSFWALNPTGIKWQYTDFNGASDGEYPAGNAVKGIVDGATEKNYTYVHENAPQDKDGKRTEVIVAARLVDKEGNKIKLADFNGFKFIGENYKDEVLKAVANMINVWKKEAVTGGGFKYSSIEGDLELKTATELGIYDEEDPDKQVGSFYVYAQLKEGAKDNVYVDADDDSGAEVDDLDKRLLDLPYIKFWTEGNTYYFVEIKHLNDVEWSDTDEEPYPVGKFGVVRNHWYQFEITNVFGLGTPVFKPSEKIIPEDPNQHESYLAAKININSWRLVKQSATLGQR